MTQRAAAERVLVRLDDPEKVTATGIIIPENAQEKSVNGTVLSVGSAIKESGIVEGVRVVLKDAYAGAVLPSANGETVVSVFEDEILALLG